MVQHLENVELLADASASGHSSHMAHTPRCPARGSPGKQKTEGDYAEGWMEGQAGCGTGNPRK